MKRQLWSATITAMLALAAPVASAALLAVDVNDRQSTDSPDTAPGFSPYLLIVPSGGTAATAVSGPSAQAVGAYTVTLTAIDDGLDENTVTAGVQNTVGQIDDRDRGAPVDAGALTYGQLYDDIVFAGTSNGPTGGMDLAVSGGALLPNKPYRVSVYSFDNGSTAVPQPRTANWLDGNSADALVFSTSFSGAALPTGNADYRYTGTFMTDASGALLLKGRNTTPNGANGAVSIGVFINGFEIDNVPEPGSLGLGLAGLVGLLAARRVRAA
jgi:hypothetical protein